MRCAEKDWRRNFVKINGCDTELCEVCATKLNLYTPSVADFFDMIFDLEDYMDARYEERVCPACGMRESQLVDGYKFGCSKCYDVFADRAEEYFKELRGTEYRGRFVSDSCARKTQIFERRDSCRYSSSLQYARISRDKVGRRKNKADSQ